jgi:predicted NAD-dependent protein-ADP-ribosyltransferase YbiA (DUF1768 family)
MIKIVKVYDKQVPGTYREYCGRPGKGQSGLLGNPFAANVTHSNRDEVCNKFEIYFKESMAYEHSVLKKRVNELVEIAKTQDIELACFCQSPKDVVKKRCHTEAIKAYIEQQLEEFKMSKSKDVIIDGMNQRQIGIIRPIINQMDCIPSFRNELAFLSNMYDSVIKSEQYQCTFLNAESAYQAMKNPEYIHNFRNIDGYEAKRLGKQVELRSDWNEVKLSIMEKILRAKFQGELLQKLLAVKGEIVERNNWEDSYWGVCTGKGENHLGKLLMKIRDEAEEDTHILNQANQINLSTY